MEYSTDTDSSGHQNDTITLSTEYEVREYGFGLMV